MGLVKRAGRIGGLTFLSRIFGLVRDQLFAALIGAGFYADAFVIAFRIPNLLRDLFAEGALSNAFVPTFTQTRIRESEDRAWELVRLIGTWIVLIVGPLTILAISFAPSIVQFIAPGYDDISGKKELTILLTRIMMPFLIFVSFAAVLMGIHNSHGRFSLPAFAPVLFNWVSIATGLLLWFFAADPETAVIGWAIGTLLAGFAQFAIQLVPLLRGRFSFLPKFRGLIANPGVRQIFFLMVPAVIALSGTQLNILINSILASLLEQGAPSWLNYAFRLMQLPIGVFGVAISVVALSQASNDIAKNESEKFHTNVKNSVQLSYLLTIPCAVGLWVMAEPIIQMIYERGAFTANDTVETAHALMFYAVGLPFYSSVKVKAPIFFAMNSSKTPMVASLCGVGFNIVFNLLVYRDLGHRGLALGTSLGVMINSLILTYFYHRKTGAAYRWSGFLLRIKIMISAAIMGLVTYVVAKSLGEMPTAPWIHVYVLPIVSIIAAILIYAGALWALRVDEVRTVWNTLKTKMRR